MRGTGENMDGGVEFYSTGGLRGLGMDKSYPLTIGMEGATEGRMKLGKGSPVGSGKVCFFRCSLKDTVMR